MSSFRRNSRFGIFATLLIPALLLALLDNLLKNPQETLTGQPAATSSTASTPPYSENPADEVERAWELANASGVYSFRTETEQTVDPAFTLANAGRESEITRLFVDGSVDRPADSLSMDLWQNSRAGQALSVRVENGLTSGRLGDGEWQAIDAVGDVFAPGGDPLGFLSGATNIQSAGTQTRQFEGADGRIALSFDLFTFDFDGARFSAYMQTRMDAALRERGELPAGMNADLPAEYRKITGQGEIWLDPDGLPRYIQIELDLPPRSNGDLVTASVMTELFDFDTQRIAASQVSLLGQPSTWLDQRLPATPAAWDRLTVHAALWGSLALLAVIAVRHWRSKWFYTALVSVMILSMVVTPLLQSNQAAAFYDGRQARQAEQDSAQAEAEEFQAAQAVLTESGADPHQNPLETPSEYAIEQTLQKTFESPYADFPSAPAFDVQASQTITTTDTDDDGLSDADETVWRTCAYPGAPDFCSGVADSKDSDGDGLSDGDEVNRVGTVPTLLDTDGDSITDTVEVVGYTDASGIVWYLDAYEADSNDDGILDGQECPAWSSTAAAPAPGSPCPDTDGDGTPDIYDDDNDGDGVEDAVDISPFTVASQIHNQDNPLSLRVDGLALDTPVFVDLQMRPDEPEHLTFFGMVMDWPSGDDQGQIQRVLDTTWANTSDTGSVSTASDAGYGDMRLVPYLEISIPYSDGHYGNLPVLPAFQGVPRSLDDAVGDWLDTGVTDAYGLSVQDVDSTSGDLLVYAPLGLVADRHGAGDVAFSARMPYWPSQGTDGVVDWGSDHSFRLVWFVQMLTDACPAGNPDCADEARIEDMSIIHVYDDDWRLAGLEIVEDRGLEVGIMYEDPAVDANLSLDEQLWNASWLLGNTFLRGRDCPDLAGGACISGDGQRDVTIANAVSQLDSWAADAGDLSYLEMETFSYDHEGFLAHIMMTETVTLLEDVFTPVADQTVPTLLFLTERRRRSVNLDDGSISGGLFSPDFDPDGTDNDVPETVTAGMNWNTYFDADEGAGTDWRSYDPYEYLDYLDWQLQADAFFTAASNEVEAIDEAEGRRLWAQIYYIALYTGALGLVEIDGSTAWTEDPELPEVAMASWPTETFYGATFVAFSFLTTITSSINTTLRSSVSFWQALKYAFSYNSSFYTSTVIRSLKSLGRATLVLSAITIFLIVTGVTLFAIGFFTQNESVTQKAVVILNFATLIVLSAWLFSILRTVVLIVRVAAAATNSMRVFFGLVSGLAKSSRVIGGIGLVLAIAVAWGFFIFAVVGQGLKPGTVEFNIALALAIAQTVVIIILFILEIVFGLVATIILLLLFIIDAILAILGKQGIVDWLTEQIAKAIYDIDYVIFNLDDPDRLDFAFSGVALDDPEGGFTTANGIYVSMTITTTLDTHGNSDGKRATFRYMLTEIETDIHDAYGQNDMHGEWDKQGNYIVAVQETTNLDPIPLSAAGAGINQNLKDHLYLNEAAVIPYEGCWRIPIPTQEGTVYIDVDCTWYDTKVTNHIHVGEYQVFDVLPDTIGYFASLGWSSGFPAQHDFDNDGMLGQGMGGVDPDDRNADIDGDGLPDTYELTIGLDPQSADTDGDGLADPDELTRRTNPLSADTDGDGLDDYTEVVVGWLVVYDGQNHLTRVWSDPTIADADNDTLTDLEEFAFGFNPWTATDPSAINDLIAFDNITVHEANAPMMLFAFEDPPGSDIFRDRLGRGYTGACSPGDCPALEVEGKFGNGAEFVQDQITVPNFDFPSGSFTVAGWIKRAGTVHQQLFLHGGEITDPDALQITIFPSSVSNFFTCAWGTSATFSSSPILPGVWTHFACVYDAEADTRAIYIDGQLENTSAAGGGHEGPADLLIGSRPDLSLPYSGTLDEIAIFPAALDAGDIAVLMEGRYVLNDLLVAPGDPLRYQATISNTHPSQAADGLMTAGAHYFDPAIGVPDVVLRFEAEEKESTFIDTVGQSSTATCLSDLTCPGTGADGNRYNSIEFDGADDYVLMPIVGEAFDGYTLAFWIRVDSLPAQNSYILDTAGEAPGALDIYLTPTGTLIFDVAGGDIDFICRRTLNNNIIDCTNDPDELPPKPETAFSLGGGNLNKWWFFGIIGTPNGANVYINPDNGDSANLAFTVAPTGDPITHAHVGPGVIGNSVDFDAPLDARFDDFVFYNVQVASPTATNNKELSEKVYQGIYWFDYIGYSAKSPTFILEFNEVGVDFPGAPFFIDNNQVSDHATCDSPATCPVRVPDGAVGRAIELDGVDDYALVAGSIMSKTGTIDMSFYINPDSLPDPGHVTYIFDSGPTTKNWLNIYFDSTGRIFLERVDEGFTPGSCFTPCDPGELLQPGVWRKVRILISNKFQSGNKQYAFDFWIDDVLTNSGTYCSAGGGGLDCHQEKSSIGQGWIGGLSTSVVPSGFTGVEPFHGRLDQLNLAVGNYTFDPASMEVGYLNTMNAGLTAHCPSVWACPEVASGVFGEAAFFDGVEDHLAHDRLDFVRGDYTIATWFKTDDAGATRTILSATDPASGHPGVLLQVQGGAVHFTDRFPAGPSGGGSVASSGGYADGQWHHVVAIKEDDTLTLILDGASIFTGPSSNDYGNTVFDVSIGRYGSEFWSGSLDELLIIPSAIANGEYNAAEVLMATRYPAIHIDDDFEVFQTAAQSAATAQGTAFVDEGAVNSFHLFEQEVEAALQLQTALDYPILDGNAANLKLFVPFEEVPNAALFLNVDPDTTVDFSCTDIHCPASGLRGKVGRTAFFDGVNDYLTVTSGTNAGINSIAAWVYGDRGTLIMTDDFDGMELDFNRFRVWYKGGADNDLIEEVINFDLPENTWTHLIATFDPATGDMKVYVNGVLNATAGIGPAASAVDRTLHTIGANLDASDPFHGYLDDLRLYSNVLSDAQALALYEETTPQLQFEFDEDENAAVFLDKSVNELVGEPVPSVCYDLTLVSMTVNSLENAGSTVNFRLGDHLLAQGAGVGVGSFALNSSTLLCGSETLEVRVAFDGSTTSLGTAPIDAVPTTADLNFSAGGNDIDVTYTVSAEPVYRVNPAPGIDGKIGNTALFDGEGFLTVRGADAVNGLVNDLTIMLWIMPDDLAGRQRLVASARTNSINGFGFGLDGDNLLFTSWGNEDLLATATQIDANIWQHVAVVFDGSNTAKFYVDGVLEQTIPGSFPISPNGDDVLMIGGTTGQLTAEILEMYSGQLDELQVYNRSLTGAEIFAFYLRELRWYRDRGSSIVRVDADHPQVERLGGDYYANEEIDLVVSAVDPTSAIRYVEYALKAPSDGGFSDWQPVAVCADSAAEGFGAAWCLAIDPTTLDGEGRYDLNFRAFDSAGNATEITDTIWVDGTPPIVETVYTGQWLPVTEDPDVALAWTLTITGTVSDPDIGSDPGSGLLVATESSTKTLQVTLYDSNLDPAGDGTQATSVVNGAFAVEYRFAGQPPQGVYSIDVRLADNAGNLSPSLLPGNPPSVRLDARAPSVELNLWNMPVAISETLTLSGTIVDAADPGGSVAQYHFEEAGAPFHDHSYEGNHAECTACPAAGAAGQFGDSIAFDGTNQYLSVTLTNTLNIITGTFSAAMWVNVDDFSTARTLLSQRDGSGEGRSWLFLNSVGHLSTMLGDTPLSGSTSLTPGQWHHVALTYDGVDITLYVDAAPVVRAPRTVVDADGAFILGLHKNLTSDPFKGLIDEFTLFSRALSPSDVYTLAQSEAIGVSGVDVWLETFPFTGTLGIPDWQPAALAEPGGVLSGWSFPIPADLEDYYRIHLRGTDAFSNTGGMQTLWRGVIDQLAPRITLIAQFDGYGSAASTTFTFEIEDRFLEENGWTLPCPETTVPLAFEYDPDTGLMTKAGGSCRVAGHGEPGTFASLTACDLFGHCSSESVELGGGEPVSSVLIRSPEPDALIPFTGEAIPIEIGAFAAPGTTISILTVGIDNVLIDSITFTETVTDTIWTTVDWLPAAPGTYMLSASLEDSNGVIYKDTIQVEIDVNEVPVANAGGPYLVDEGASVQFEGTGSILPEDPPFLTYEWDYDYDGVTFDTDAVGAMPVFDAAVLDGPITYTVALRVTDQTQLTDIATSTVTVSNVSPLVAAGSDQTALIGQPVVFEGSFSDPGVLDTHDVAWGFGDGTGEVGTLTPTHPFDAPGVYTVTLVVLDDDNGQGSDTLVVTVLTPLADIEDFVVLGLEGVYVHHDTDLLSGDIGANAASDGPFLAAGAEVAFGDQVELYDPASRVFGDTVFMGSNTAIFDVYYNELEGQGTVNGMHHTPLFLPLLVELPEMPDFTPGTTNVNVPRNRRLSLEPGDYGVLSALHQSTVVFTGGVYNFVSWDIRSSVDLLFLAPTEIRIADKLLVRQDSYVGPDPSASGLGAADIMIYVNGVNGTSGAINATPYAAVFGNNTTLTANVFVPNGTLQISHFSRATGAFIGKWVRIGEGVELALESGYENP